MKLLSLNTASPCGARDLSYRLRIIKIHAILGIETIKKLIISPTKKWLRNFPLANQSKEVA